MGTQVTATRCLGYLPAHPRPLGTLVSVPVVSLPSPGTGHKAQLTHILFIVPNCDKGLCPGCSQAGGDVAEVGG